MSKAHGPLADRPNNPKVGLEIPHESAPLHVTGKALYTDDLVARTKDVLYAWPLQAPHAHALVTRLNVEPAYAVPGVVRVLTAADVPGVNDAGIKHDEPLFPSEVMFYGHAVVWVLGESTDAARQGADAIEVEYQPLPSLLTLTEAIEAESFQGTPRTVSRGDVDAGFAAAAQTFSGEFEFGGQEHFYLETNAALALVDENGQIFVQSSTQHPSETQEIVSHVLGLSSHHVTVQCLRMGGGFGGKEMQPHGFAAIAALGAILTGRPVLLRLNRTQDITMTGKRHPFHAEWKVGFDADNRLCALTATLTSDGGWSLDLSEPVLARALCHIDNSYWVPNILVHGRIGEDQQDLADRVPRVRRAAGHDRDGGHPGPVRPAAGNPGGRTASAQLLRAGTGNALRAAGAARRAAGRHLVDPLRPQRLRPPAGRGRRVQRHPPGHQAGAGHDPGEVRHLVQPDRLQPGRRAGARLQGRLGADQSRRRRDGTGPAHQDDPGGGHRARGAAELRPAGPDPHRQGAEHVGHRGQLGRGHQRRRHQERVRPDPRSGSTSSRPASWASTRTTSGTSTG